MKIKIILATVALTLVAVASTASARGLTKADKALANKAMKYIGAMATIIEKAADKPDAAISELETYIGKNHKAIVAVSAKLDKVEGELDAEAKAELQKYVQERPEMKKFMNAVMGFFTKHGQDEKRMERMTKALEKLQSAAGEGKKKEAPKK